MACFWQARSLWAPGQWIALCSNPCERGIAVPQVHRAGCATCVLIAIPDCEIGGEVMTRSRRRKVLISYHHREDQEYKNRFVRMMSDCIVDKSVDTGDIIDQGLPVDEIRRRIRDDYIADATVTVVLIGRCTWQRKHVDWEISASLIDTAHNDRCGLLGIRLPTHTDFRDAECNPSLIPPRLAYNCGGNDPFAAVHRWSGSANEVDRVRRWIDEAFSRRLRPPDPDDSYPLFARNRQTDCSRGWQSYTNLGKRDRKVPSDVLMIYP